MWAGSHTPAAGAKLTVGDTGPTTNTRDLALVEITTP